jgi:ketosteroid isomerase-like protein
MSAKHKEIIEKVNAAFSKNDPEVFLGYCTDDVKWSMAGDEPKTGKDTIREWIKSMGPDMGPPKINTTGIISEGDSAACYGDMTMNEKGVENAYSFCDVYTFSGDKITELRSFAVKEKGSGETKKSASA